MNEENVRSEFYRKRPVSRLFYQHRLPLDVDFTPLYPFSIVTSSAFAVNIMEYAFT